MLHINPIEQKLGYEVGISFVNFWKERFLCISNIACDEMFKPESNIVFVYTLCATLNFKNSRSKTINIMFSKQKCQELLSRIR